MKLAIAALSALTLMNVGAANAAIASYDFEGATDGSITTANFGGALAPLGVTSSTITGGTGLKGVFNNGGNSPNASFGTKSFAPGELGAWSLVFSGGVTSFGFSYNETESTVGGTTGFTAQAYALDGTTLLASQSFGQGIGSFTFSSLGTIGKVVITDLGDASHPAGDNVQLDNLVVDTVTGIPEPSTYMMIGSALAGLAVYRRRA